MTTLRGRYQAMSVASIRVSQVMHRGVVTCKPDASLDTVARLLAAHRIHAVAVRFQDDADAWGIVSDLDLVAALTRGELTATAGDVASAPSVSVGLDDTLAHAMQLMSERSSHHVIVLGRASRRPVGVVSTLDVAEAVAELPSPDSLVAWLGERSRYSDQAQIHREAHVSERKNFTTDDARLFGSEIGIDWNAAPFDVEQFRIGMNVELEHGLRDPATNVSDDDPHVTARIALAHLNEFPDYYTRLERMEEEAKRDWSPRERD